MADRGVRERCMHACTSMGCVVRGKRVRKLHSCWRAFLALFYEDNVAPQHLTSHVSCCACTRTTAKCVPKRPQQASARVALHHSGRTTYQRMCCEVRWCVLCAVGERIHHLQLCPWVWCVDVDMRLDQAENGERLCRGQIVSVFLTDSDYFRTYVLTYYRREVHHRGGDLIVHRQRYARVGRS